MNIAIFQRLLWKEFRQQWAFWVAMVFLTMLLMVLFEVMFALLGVRPREDSYHLIYVFCLAVLYALGCGATLFATEHDTGTYQTLRNLPVSSFLVFMSKITLALFATVSLVIVLYIPTYLLAGYFSKNIEVFPWPVWYLGLGSALAWGSLFSQLVKRPLLAAFLGGTVGCASYLLVVILLEKWFFKVINITACYAVSSGILIALCMANAWFGRRWLRSRSPYIGRTAARWGLIDSSLAALDGENLETPRTSTILRRLTWQQWRFSWQMMGVYALAFVVLFSLLTALIFKSYHPGHLHKFFFPVLRGYTLFLSCCLISLFGASVFHGDQRGHSVRFLAERAARPWHVWFSRQIVWATPFLLVGLVSFLFCILYYFITVITHIPASLEHTTWQKTAWWCLWRFWQDIVLRTPEWFAIVALIFAAGQLCSMLFRSGLLAITFGLTLSGICAGWIALMTLLGISPLWSVLPIAIGMLWATLMHTPDWMRDRSGWQQYMRPAAAAVVPIMVIVVVIPFYRVYSIPGGGPGFDVAEYTRPETEAEKATVNMYRKATAEMKTHHPADMNAWAEANEKAVELALAASRQEACGKLDWQAIIPPNSSSAVNLVYLVVADGNRLTNEGKLDLAAERYFAALRMASHLKRGITFRGGVIAEGQAYDGLRSWAAAPGQTLRRIKVAIDEIDSIAKSGPSYSEFIKDKYMQARSELMDDQRNTKYVLSDLADNWLIFQWYALPWERARLLRLLNRAATNDLQALKDMDYTPIHDETASIQSFMLSPEPAGYLVVDGKNAFREPVQVSGVYEQIASHELMIQKARQVTKDVLEEARKLER